MYKQIKTGNDYFIKVKPESYMKLLGVDPIRRHLSEIFRRFFGRCKNPYNNAKNVVLKSEKTFDTWKSIEWKLFKEKCPLTYDKMKNLLRLYEEYVLGIKHAEGGSDVKRTA